VIGYNFFLLMIPLSRNSDVTCRSFEVPVCCHDLQIGNSVNEILETAGRAALGNLNHDGLVHVDRSASAPFIVDN
jgi:hypothetical protein